MDKKLLLTKLDEILAELDACAEDEEIEELAAELEDAIFLLECAEDGEETEDATEEIAALAAQLREVAGEDAALRELAERFVWLMR